MLETLYQSTKTFPVGIGYWPEVIYIASLDAVLYAGWTFNSGYRKVFRDGTFFEMNSRAAFSGNFLSAADGRGAATVVNGDDTVDIALLDEISCLPLLGEPLNGVDFAGKARPGSVVDHLNGLVYTPGGWSFHEGMYFQEVKVYALARGVLQDTLSVPLGTVRDWNYTLARLHSAGASLLLLSVDTGSIAIFDGIKGSVKFKGKIPNTGRIGTAYDVKHNVIISLLNSGHVAVYALNNVGYDLAAPSFSPPPALYTLSRLTTRLTADDGQGVVDKPVFWYLTGGKGYLESVYSLTDENGYAHNWYYGPDGDYGLGQESVNVEVVV